jgi:hypothetical protein
MRATRLRGGGVELDLAPVEVAVLASAARDLLELLTADAAEGPRDPLEELVGLSPGARRPDDPALQRLLPDAYRPSGDLDDAQADAASAEFRRFTDADLRARKRAAADAVLEGLAALDGGGRLPLDRDACDAWLVFLTDVRLVLGVRLDVRDDTLEEAVDPDDPRAPALELYSWLGWVQESLLAHLDPRPS